MAVLRRWRGRTPEEIFGKIRSGKRADRCDEASGAA